MADAERLAIRLLLVENSDSWTQRVLNALAAEGHDVVHARASTETELRDALHYERWDLLLASDTVAGLDSQRILELAHREDSALACVVAQHCPTRESGIAALRSGMRDCVSHDDALRVALIVQREVLTTRQRRAVAERVRAAHDQATAIVEAIDLPLVTLDEDFHVLSANPAFLRAFSFTGPFTARSSLASLLRLGPGDPLLGKLARLNTHGAGFSEHEVELSLLTGSRTFLAAGQRINDRDAGPALSLLSLREITEQYANARKMEEAQRMEAVGQLAGGVAHDFNNLLTVIQSYAAFLRDSLQDEEPALEDIQMITSAASRAAQLTSQLLAFSRRQVQSLENLDINLVLSNLERMLSRVIGEAFDLVTRLFADPASIRADVAQLEQIVINLVINARDAMPNGGKVVIETSNQVMRKSRVDSHGVMVPAGRYVKLTVTDTGSGMDEATCKRVFEPFFTTKRRGTGLGLSSVYGMVAQSNGHISVRSRPGHGTVFKILFPQVAGEGEGEGEPARKRSERPPSGSETVLLVEDEEAVRKAAARTLTRDGYHVLQAENPEQALETWARLGKTVDLLVTDLVMPGMSGRSLAERLRQDRPELPVVFMSGYTDDDVVHRGGLHGLQAQYLQKPFAPQALLKTVRRAFDI